MTNVVNDCGSVMIFRIIIIYYRHKIVSVTTMPGVTQSLVFVMFLLLKTLSHPCWEKLSLGFVSLSRVDNNIIQMFRALHCIVAMCIIKFIK